MLSFRLNFVPFSLLLSAAAAANVGVKPQDRPRARIMKSCYDADLPSLITALGEDSTLHKQTCFRYIFDYEYGKESGLPASLDRKTPYDAVFIGLAAAGPTDSEHKSKAKECLRQLLNSNVPLRCDNEHIVRRVIRKGLGTDLAILALQKGASVTPTDASAVADFILQDVDGGIMVLYTMMTCDNGKAIMRIDKNPLKRIFENYLKYEAKHRGLGDELIRMVIEQNAFISFPVVQACIRMALDDEGILGMRAFQTFIHAIPHPADKFNGKRINEIFEERIKRAARKGRPRLYEKRVKFYTELNAALGAKNQAPVKNPVDQIADTITNDVDWGFNDDVINTAAPKKKTKTRFGRKSSKKGI